nr:glycosyltransferase family 2 protein [Flavobacterium panacagri]
MKNQTDKRFKAYIGNDASSECPLNLIEKYQDHFNLVYHRFDENFGKKSLVKQWDRCIALSNSEKWLMILGDDDVLGENVVASFYEQYELFNEKSEVIRYASKIINQELNTVSEIFINPVWEKPTDSFFRKYQWLSRSSLSEYIFTKKSYETFRFKDYPLAWYSDDMAWLDFSNNKPIYSINNSIVYFRMSASNISGREDNLEEKEKSEYLFYQRLVKNHLLKCNSNQKRIFLLEFGVIAKKTKQLNFSTCILIISKLLRSGLFYSCAKFIRRVYRAKLNH